jgi:hypothetical protein
MMKVAVIGYAPSEILSACQTTITSLAKKKEHVIYAIIAPSDEAESLLSLSQPEISNVPELAAIGITQTFIIEKFDYSAITQVNADAVNSYIKNVKPSLVIMPSWKSPNHFRKILARTSLIACRGIGTILMYELDVNNTSFNPNVTFEASVECSLTLEQQQQRTSNITETAARTTAAATDQDEIDDAKTFKNKSMVQHKDSKASNYKRLEEKFESHRTLLLEEEEGLF